MKRNNYLKLALVGTLLVLSLDAMSSPYQQRIVWKEHQSETTGLYTTKSHFATDGVSIGVHALYYYGDADNEGVMFKGGFNPNNIGGLVTVAYHMPVSAHWIMRFSLSGGLVRADNTKMMQKQTPPRDDYRTVKNIFAQPAVGVEWYPLNRYGLFLYGGISCTVGFIDYNFFYNAKDGSGRANVTGKTYGILPMIQGGLGYSWNLSQSWMLSVQAMFQEGLYDAQYLNLDAYPLDKSQNSQGVSLGTAGGYWKDKEGKKRVHWNDGWFQLGITVTYRWSNCEQCRILHNYSRIKNQRK